MARQRVQPLSVFEVPLTGMNLIEASAGTGKTNTITELYVRYILETERQVSQILVVTFTVAATAELRDRILRRLVEAHTVFSGGTTEDAFCQHLATSFTNWHQARHKLDTALWGFDEAAIYTIHGFCERVLADRAFESGLPFETVLLPDERELLQDIVDDFWRRTVYDASPLFVRYLLDEGASPEQLLQTIRPHVGKPYLTVVQAESEASACAGRTLTHIETTFAEAYQEVRDRWQDTHAQVEELLLTSAALDRRKYRKDSIPPWIHEMTTSLAAAMPHLALGNTFHRFTDRYLAGAVKGGQQPPRHPFFSACDVLASAHAQLCSSYSRQLRALKVSLFAYCQHELSTRKRRRHVQSYDDLLVNLARALASRQGKALAEAIRRRYTVALIDEFQDTDPVQYSIFQQLYHDTTVPVFFVGDPKQAIYSFRGADIFAYLKACRDADDHYTLEVNWRSDPALITAVNTLSLNFSEFVARQIWRRRSVFLLRGRAHRLHRREPFRGLLRPLDIFFDHLQTAIN